MSDEWGIPKPDERLLAERLGISVTTLRRRLAWGERVEQLSDTARAGLAWLDPEATP